MTTLLSSSREQENATLEATMHAPKPSWLVFSDDWGRHPSSCQYLIQELLDEIDVTWINTIGMRTPKLDRASVTRALELLTRKRTKRPSITTANLLPTVVRPMMWPWFTRARDRKLNAFLLNRKLSSIVKSWAHPRIAVTTIPIVADLVGVLPIDHWVYYCVDDFSTWPGLDQKTMLSMEQKLLKKVDRIVAASDVLQERIHSLGHCTTRLTHGVNLENWQPDTSARFPWPTSVSKPILLFWGVIDRRLDIEIVSKIATGFPYANVVFVGPEQQPHRALSRLANVTCLPPVPPETLAIMAKDASCLIMPYADLPVVRAMQPLKLKEYLATGKPVIARRTPATHRWNTACDLADNAAQFIAAISKRIAGHIPHEQHQARQRLQSETWKHKARKFLEQVQSEHPSS